MFKFPSKVLKIGDKGEEVKKLHKYLKAFGYMKSDKMEILGYKIDSTRASEESEKEDIFDMKSANAVRFFQEFNKLPVTGTLDEETLAFISKPRCGVPDIVERTQFRFNVSGRRWHKSNLTYRFENYTDRLPREVIRRIIVDALAQWSNVTPLKFCEVGSAGDIRILWAKREHGDGQPFDGPSGVFGHASLPENGRVHFDDDEGWMDDNLTPKALHEFGHALGLLDTTDPNTVMHGSDSNLFKLQPDDISAIQSVYGPFIPISLVEILTAKGISLPASIRSVAENIGLAPPISVKQLGCHLQL